MTVLARPDIYTDILAGIAILTIALAISTAAIWTHRKPRPRDQDDTDSHAR